MLRLLIVGGGGQPRYIELVDEVITIGSEGSIQLSDASIGKQALTLRRTPAGGYIAEPGEGWVQRNRTRFVKAAPVSARDEFRIGPFRLTFEEWRVVRKTVQPPPAAGGPAKRELTPAERHALIVDARARMTWGEDATAVKDKLVAGGMPWRDADELVNTLEKAQLARTRRRGIAQIVLGGIVGVAGVLVTMYLSAHLNDSFAAFVRRTGFPTAAPPKERVSVYVALFGPFLIAVSLSLLVSGIYRALSPTRERE